MTFEELSNLVSSKKAPGLCLDSRLVKDGDIFIAVEGTVYDGHDFIDQAIANGAKYIITQTPQDCRDAEGLPICDLLQNGAQVITVANSAKAAALLAQASRGNPASQLTNLAVTGTNGKTTVAFLVRSCIAKSGEKCGLVGTIIYDTGAASFEAALTTPDCLTIAERQSQMLKAGSKYMVIEASSHALYQDRLASINFRAAAFTNLAGDHLDYHKTETDYLAAKGKLFQALSPDATAVLNKQSPHALELAGKTKARILWYAVDEPTDLTAHLESMDMTGTVFILKYSGQSLVVKTPLLGRYNATNHLAAAGLCIAAGFDLETIATGLSALKTIPGRLERIDWDGDICVFIDYAHTDDALKSVLSTLKPLCTGKLSVVFGCGGDRDRTKRPRMARVAEQLADSVIVTSDNPRTEDPEDIINEIATGFENPDSQTITIEPDRKKAIESAIKTAAKNDIVLIAGKGHETYQIIGEDKIDFSDKAIAEEYLKKRK
jgi:UDP-N-acetylmuramoyl-L-alanyl-D-glutamate--2,6-diaminopimelate ligase